MSPPHAGRQATAGSACPSRVQRALLTFLRRTPQRRKPTAHTRSSVFSRWTYSVLLGAHRLLLMKAQDGHHRKRGILRRNVPLPFAVAFSAAMFLFGMATQRIVSSDAQGVTRPYSYSPRLGVGRFPQLFIPSTQQHLLCPCALRRGIPQLTLRMTTPSDERRRG